MGCYGSRSSRKTFKPEEKNHKCVCRSKSQAEERCDKWGRPRQQYMKTAQKLEEPGKYGWGRPSLKHENDSKGPLPARGHLSLDKVGSLKWGWKFVNTVNVWIITVEKQWVDGETVCQALPRLKECIWEKAWSTGPWCFPVMEGEKKAWEMAGVLKSSRVGGISWQNAWHSF